MEALTDSSPLTLRRNPFEPLALGAVRPAGWILDQLRVQADGLSGHLDEFWPSLKDSAWIGGKTEAWERGPYWLDGIVPLAVLLNDERLLAKAKFWIDYILDHQRADGWLGPVLKGEQGQDVYDTWPLFVLFKAFTQWHSATDDERIIPAMQRAMRFIFNHIQREPIFGWGQYRTADLVLSMQWLYERTRESWLVEFQELIEKQGFDWRSLYDDYPYKQKTPNLITGAGCISGSHGPNAAMGLKQPALRYRVNGNPADRDAVFHMIETLDRYHGQASGVFSCDEHLAGCSPTQGTELCAVVEYLFSLETVIAVLGVDGATLADRMEQIAFNALPAAFSTDMWSHQYDQQANQIVAKRFTNPVWTDNNGDANTFGLEPHFGCCTANFHQGWPKFVSHAWMRQADDGALVTLSYVPVTVRQQIAGVNVTIDVESAYPFDESVALTIRADRPVRVPLLLRIPEWARGATVEANGRTQSPTAGTFCAIEVDAGSEPTHVRLRLPMRVRMTERANRAAIIHRGPIVFSLKMDEAWKQFRGEHPHCDYEVISDTQWNVALSLNSSHPDVSFDVKYRSPGSDVFSPNAAAVRLIGRGKLLSSWQVDPRHEVAGDVPQSPVNVEGSLVPVELIPFGAAKLRVTEFPWTEVNPSA